MKCKLGVCNRKGQFTVIGKGYKSVLLCKVHLLLNLQKIVRKDYIKNVRIKSDTINVKYITHSKERCTVCWRSKKVEYQDKNYCIFHGQQILTGDLVV